MHRELLGCSPGMVQRENLCQLPPPSTAFGCLIKIATCLCAVHAAGSWALGLYFSADCVASILASSCSQEVLLMETPAHCCACPSPATSQALPAAGAPTVSLAQRASASPQSPQPSVAHKFVIPQKWVSLCHCRRSAGPSAFLVSISTKTYRSGFGKRNPHSPTVP